jgi:arylsulfatase A-like enzyme
MSSLWTGLEPGRHHNGVPYDSPLPREQQTLAALLQSRGVASAGFVANAMAGRAYGLDRGFTEFHELAPQQQLLRGVERWLQGRRGERVFTYVHVLEPHFPYDPAPPFDLLFGSEGPLPVEARRDPGWYREVNRGRPLSAAEREHLVRLYDGVLATGDARVAELRRILERLELLERTVVIVTADHGEALYEHGFISHNEQVYEESTHVPLVMRLPRGVGTPGLRLKGLATTADLAPTIAELLDVPAGPGGAHGPGGLGGSSLLPMLAGAPGRGAVVTRSAGEESRYALREDRFKYVVDTRHGAEELFDLAHDPAERQDLSAREPVRLAAYRQALQRHVLQLRRSPRARPAERAPLAPEQLENLRALGYVN